MKKSDFITLVAGVLGGLLFSIGMCMCLLPEWNLFREGVAVTAAGGMSLIVLAVVLRVRSGRKCGKINWKLVGKIVYGVFAALVFGIGLSLILVWKVVLPGIAVGAVGICLLLGLIPMIVGLK